jgi:hypothetical protein
MITHLGDGRMGHPDHPRSVVNEELSHLIGERCVRPDHQGNPRGVERVFMHGRVWAYCPAGRAASDHHLIPTGGVELRRLEGGQSSSRTH